jgi:hypothetical protein
MKIRMLWSGLAASAVLLAAGTALPGGTASTTENQLVDFNQSTGELWAYPTGKPITTYLHGKHTVHALADLSRFLPPDPCMGLAQAWNATVAYDDGHQVRSAFVFEVLLTLMSDFQCRATVTSTNGTPQPIVVITPIAK